MTDSKRAILLLAHGTPDSVDQVPEYLRNITGGRSLPDEVIAEVTHRYDLIGRSPLTDITMEQARALEQQTGIPVYVGMRNWHPFIADTIKQMVADGVTHVVAICLAPQNSQTSVGLYRRATFIPEAENLQIDFVDAWHDHPLLLKAFAERLETASTQAPSRVPVIFTAHSVPCRTILAGDPYGVQCRQSAAAVATKVGLTDDEWFFAFQSQGMSGGPWIGPTVEETITGLRAVGHHSVLVQPIGFVCDHVEVLYDIDLAFNAFAKQLGMALSRTASLNTSPPLIAALADIAQTRFAAHTQPVAGSTR